LVSECCASAAVSARWAAGGLVGLNGGTIQSSWAAGHISGVSGLGGLVGENWKWIEIILDIPLEYDGVITDCYALTDVTCEESQGGGLLGTLKGGTVLRCYAAGHVFGPQDIGGLIGHTSTEYPSTVDRSFWDINATGLTLSAGGAGLTTPQMQDRATYINAGWDFIEEADNGNDDVWYIPEAQDYPRLAWERQDQTTIEQ
jgi:hypothetical protein